MDNKTDDDLKREYVDKQLCWAKLSDEEKDGLAKLFMEIHVKSGETIVTEGEPVDSIYIIILGTADVRHVTVQDGVQQVQSLASLTVGNAIGLKDTGFYSLSGVRTATVVATTDMVLIKLNLPQFHGFALAFPHVNEVMRKNAEEILGEIK